MKKIFILPVIFALSAALLLPLLSFDSRADDDHSDRAALENDDTLDSALIEEMHTLDAVFRDIVSDVALGNSAAVVETLDHMHGKKERTEEALRSKRLHLPRNADKTILFKKLDGEFHADLRMLERAARNDEKEYMVAITKRLLERCVTCHTTFRN